MKICFDWVIFQKGVSEKNIPKSFSYCNMPNKGTGHDSKVKSDVTEEKLSFWAFQRWFWIENRSIIMDSGAILVNVDFIVGPPSKGGAFIRVCAFIRHITVIND